jgi:hypothetical protein
MHLGGKVMTNTTSAEPLAGRQYNSADDDNALTEQTKPSGATNRPHLRIVHSANPLQAPPADMPPPDRCRHVSDRLSDRVPAMLDRTVQAQIGRLLRDVFADVAAEPVPERFITLLAQLETEEEKHR